MPTTAGTGAKKYWLCKNILRKTVFLFEIALPDCAVPYFLLLYHTACQLRKGRICRSTPHYTCATTQKMYFSPHDLGKFYPQTAQNGKMARLFPQQPLGLHIFTFKYFFYPMPLEFSQNRVGKAMREPEVGDDSSGSTHYLPQRQ